MQNLLEEGVLAPSCGVLLVDKPVGPTSFRVVQQVRRALKIKKIGHAGTLDPFASGLLIVCISRNATKHIDRFMVGEKEYIATLQLGVETDTLDPEGQVTAQRPVPVLTVPKLNEILSGFLGEQQQVPPQYSAVKYKGKPLYHYARKGVVVEKDPRLISIHELDLLWLEEAQLQIRVVCSKGTYIRVLAADIGHALGCGAHLIALRRTRSGCFSVAQALDGNLLVAEGAAAIIADKLLDVDECLSLLH